jgi:hypothetical protein
MLVIKRAHHARHRLALPQAVGGQHVQQFIAVEEAPCRVDHLQPVGVAVQRHAVVGAVLRHRLDQRGRRRGAHAIIDVQAIGVAADGDHRGAQFVKDIRCHVVARAVRGVHDDLHATQRQAVRHGALAKFDVAPAGIGQAARLAQAGRIGPLGRQLQGRFDLGLPLVGELFTPRRKELDAVVGKGVVRSADDHTQIQPQGPGEIGDARRGQRAAEQHVHASRCKAGFQRRLQHVARDARVLADQHRGALRAAAQHMPHRMAQAQHEVWRDGRLAHRAPNAVRTEIASAHHLAPWP